jgi:hypothetical protein
MLFTPKVVRLRIYLPVRWPYTVNNHEVRSTLYSRRVPSNYYFSYSYSYSISSHNRPLPTLLAHHVRPQVLRSFPFPLPYPPPASRMFVSTERLSSAWRHTPMKWNPLPWFVGALLLVLIQYRRHRNEKEVYVDEDGHEVIKLKGPWQVGVFIHSLSGHTFFFWDPQGRENRCHGWLYPYANSRHALAAVSAVVLHERVLCLPHSRTR